VDLLDAVLVGRAWQATRGDDRYSAADLDNDGSVDIFDALAVGRNWGDGATSPSPTTAANG
jgi:hypothetical protein